MSTTLICNNVYQLYLAWALGSLGVWPGRIHTVISVGDRRLAERATEVAAESGWRHLHRACPSSFIGQVACGTALAIRPFAGLRDVLNTTRSLVVFNDTHPCTVQIRGRCRHALVSLVEEGTGLHRSRPVGTGRRWLASLFVPALNVSGRQGEAPWVDELWVSQVDSLTPVQRRKRIVTFDRAAVVSEMRRRWRTVPRLPADDRPVLLLLGQPFVEDGVLIRSQADAMLRAVATTLPRDLEARMVLAYKPHPREWRPRVTAGRVLGPDALVLDQHAPLETMDFGGRPLFVLSFTSGAVRDLGGSWQCVSVAACFPALTREIGSTSTFPGVTFLSDLGRLPREIDAFLERVANQDRA